MLVDGRLGGAKDGGVPAPLTLTGVPILLGGPEPSPEGGNTRPGGPIGAATLAALEGGPDGGAVVALVTLLGPLGGGGVAATGAAASAPAFLLTHFLRVSS